LLSLEFSVHPEALFQAFPEPALQKIVEALRIHLIIRIRVIRHPDGNPFCKGMLPTDRVRSHSVDDVRYNTAMGMNIQSALDALRQGSDL
jgi:hypothetical protein